MKKTITLLSAVLFAAITFAQAPNILSYQAVIRNPTGTLVANQTVGMRISILQGSSTGASQYEETQTPTTNANGLVTLLIGGGNVLSGSMATINWGGDAFWIKTETDPAGGNNYTITGTSQLLSVPYALNAANGNWTISGNNIFNSNSGNVGIGTSSPSNKLELIDPNPVFQIGTPSGDFGRIYFGNSAHGIGRGMNISSLTDNNDVTLFTNGSGSLGFATNSIERMRINPVGSVGIGTSSPVGLLEVKTGIISAIIDNSGYNNNETCIHPSSPAYGDIGNLTFRWYRIYANTYYGINTSIQSLSDRRLKENIQPLAPGLIELMQLKPVSYNFIPEKIAPNEEARKKLTDKDIKNQMGFIAQDVQEIFPQLVRTVDENSDILSLGYSGLIPVMVKSIQEQQAQIELLKKQLAELLATK